MRDLTCALCLGSNCGDLSDKTLSKFQITASALKAEPSWNFTPSRRLKIHFFRSVSSTFQDVANPGTSLPGRSLTFASQAISGS